MMPMTFLEGMGYLFLVLAGIQLFYSFFFFARLAFYKSKPEEESEETRPALSVIVYAQYVDYYLRQNLPLFLDQDYYASTGEVHYELIVIGDNLADETKYYFNDLLEANPHLSVIHIDGDSQGIPGKKYGITLAMKKANHDWVVVTDAKCRPGGRRWLAGFAQNMKENQQFVLGYSSFEEEKGIVNKFLRLTRFFDGIHYLSFSLAGFPYIGTIRNIAYRHRLFFDSKGYLAHHYIPKENVLFVNKSTTGKNTTITINKESINRIKASETGWSWWLEKRKRFVLRRFFKFKHRFVLGLFSWSLFLFYVVFVIALFYKPLLYITCGVFLFRLVIQGVIWFLALGKLEEKRLIGYCWPYELISIFYEIIASFQVIKKKKNFNGID